MMASQKHDFMVAAIARKIRSLGFSVTYVDGDYVNISQHKHPIPPRIINHRPDIIGQNDFGNFCIGEAKTLNDLRSSRTKQQLVDFSEIVNLYDGNYLILGIPLSADQVLDNLIKQFQLANNSLIIIKIPDYLVTE